MPELIVALREEVVAYSRSVVYPGNVYHVVNTAGLVN